MSIQINAPSVCEAQSKIVEKELEGTRRPSHQRYKIDQNKELSRWCINSKTKLIKCH
jgi:hypothetical protein